MHGQLIKLLNLDEEEKKTSHIWKNKSKSLDDTLREAFLEYVPRSKLLTHDVSRSGSLEKEF